MIVHEIEPLERYTKEKSRHTHAHSQSLIHLIVSTRYRTQNIVWFLFRYLCLSIPFTVGIFVKVCVCSACMCMCVFRSYVSFYVVSMLFSLILFFFHYVRRRCCCRFQRHRRRRRRRCCLVIIIITLHFKLTHLFGFRRYSHRIFPFE